MKPVELFGSGVKSYSAVATAQRRLNCFYDVRQDGDSHKIVVRGTPGWVRWTTLNTTPIRGWHVVGSYLYVVAGAVVGKLDSSGTFTSLGVIPRASNFVSMSDNGVQLMIVDGLGGYIVTIATGVLTTIVDAAFPNGATTVTFIDGRFIVNKANTRQYYISNFYDGTTWTPSIFASKENSSDPLVAVDVLNGSVILWGSSTMEFWQDVGAAPNPFARVNGATQTWGLAALWSRATVNNSMAFLGQNPQGSVQVMKLEGYLPTRISTSDIENIINSFSTFSDAVALTYIIDGHTMYQLTFPTGGRSFLYDDLTKLWSEVQTGTALVARHFGALGVVFNTINYISDSTTGAVYAMSPTTYTDDGQLIRRQVVTKHVNLAGDKFSISEVLLNMETGQGLQTGQGSDPTIMMRVSKDGGRTFGYERTTSIGRIGQYSAPRAIFRRLGSARDFVFEFTMTDPVPFVISYASASIEQGAQ